MPVVGAVVCSLSLRAVSRGSGEAGARRLRYLGMRNAHSWIPKGKHGNDQNWNNVMRLSWPSKQAVMNREGLSKIRHQDCYRTPKEATETRNASPVGPERGTGGGFLSESLSVKEVL